MDKESKNIRIKPYLINGIGLLSVDIFVIVAAYLILNSAVEPPCGYVALIMLPGLLVHCIVFFRTDFLVALDIVKGNFTGENVKVMKIKQYLNKTESDREWYREPYSMFYKNHKTCRYRLKLENLSENKEMIMYMYLTHEEAMSIDKLSENGKSFYITYLKHAKAIIKIETIE